MNNQRKRPRQHAPPDTQDLSTSALDFHVRAYEATLVYGQERFAELLRLPEDRGGHLMRWIGESGGDEDEHSSPGGRDLWIDRYDALHLLSALPPTASPSPPSSTGWTDLPSDAEDTFFLSGDEGDAYARGKKRRRMEAGRRERMEALRVKGEGEAAEREKEMEMEKDEDIWGGDDEEPPAAIRTLMEHTAKSLSASPNPQVLELRILTHHAADAKFSFLKGRYKNTWQAIKRGDKPALSTATTTLGGIGGLGGYDSDDESEEEGDPPVPSPPPLAPSEEAPAEGSQTVTERHPPPPLSEDRDTRETPVETKAVEEEQARALRREKARAWTAARRQEKTEVGDAS